MNVEEAILSRRSVRSYKQKEIPRKKIKEIIKTARMAPSAKNRQDWKFIVVDDEDKQKELSRNATTQPFVKEASAIIVGINTNPDYVMSCGVSAGIVDLSIALDHISLKAAEEGLGTCWIGSFDQEAAKHILKIPKKYKIIALMTIGHPERPLDEKIKKGRKELGEILSFNSFE